MKSTSKTKVFKRAYEIATATGKSWPVCLAKSWALARLINEMHKGTVFFAYERADGTLGKAKGTLKDVDTLIKGTGKENYKTICYFDVDRQGFRSFKVENFITIY